MKQPSPSRPNPFIGPRSFQTGEKLYGRDRETEDILDLLIAERIVLLHSVSGAGKSSLVNAALIPRLIEEGFEVLPTIRVNTELPPQVIQMQENPDTPAINRFVFSMLLSLEEEIPEPLRLSIEDRVMNPSLDYYLHQRQDLMAILKSEDLSDSTSDDAPFDDDDTFDDDAPFDDYPRSQVLIFDQFEEILTVDYANIQAKEEFFLQLREVLKSRNRWALFCMREDYVASLEPYARYVPTRMKNIYRLDLLHVSAATRAIQDTAKTAGVIIEKPVVDRLLDDLRQVQVQQSDGTMMFVTGPVVEPVQLQVACRRLWQEIPPDKTTLTEEDIPLVTSSGGVEMALADYYQDQVQRIAEAYQIHERLVREWIDKQLIIEGIRGQVMQGVHVTAGLPNEVIVALIDAHLVRSEKRRGISWFELAHDRLITPIHTNNMAWFEANLSPLQRQTTLWLNQDKLDGLLLQGKALEEAEQWAAHHKEEITEAEHEFLDECRQVRQKKLQEERKNRRIRHLAIVSATVSVIALVAFVLAAYSFKQAMDQITISDSQRLAFAAQMLNDEPETALLLAYESAATHRNPISEQVLRDALNDMQWQSYPLIGHTDVVRSASFSPDSEFIVTTSNDMTAILWDKDGIQQTLLEGHTGYVVQANFSPDSQQIVTASSDGTARIWNIDGTLETTLEGHSTGLIQAVFTHDGSHIVTSSLDRTTRIWSREGEHIATLEGYKAAISNDGAYVVTGTQAGTVMIWTIEGDLITKLAGHTGGIVALAFSPNGDQIASGSQDMTIKVWDRNGENIYTLRGPIAPVQSVQFNDIGTHIIARSLDDTIWIWNKDGTPITTLHGFATHITDSTLSPIKNRVAVGFEEGIAKLWLQHHTEPIILQGHTDSISSVTFSPNAEQIVTTSADHTARLWFYVGTPLPTLTVQSAWVDSVSSPAVTIQSNWVDSARYDREGTHILLSLLDGSEQVWTADTQQLVDTHKQPTVHNTVISPDKAIVALVQANGVVTLAHMRDGEGYATLVGHQDQIATVAFSPDGQFLATASWDTTARIWRVTDGSLVATLQGHTSSVMGVTFSPDSRYVATASNDTTARIWNLEGNQLAVLQGHQDPVLDVAFNPEGTIVATASADKTTRLWLLDGKPKTTLTEHTNDVMSVAFSPDGRKVITASQDNTVRQYYVRVDDLLEVASCRVGRELSPAEREFYNVPEPKFDMYGHACSFFSP
jgi:WD40 repeat protein/NACalpha-BTF3-like transcription factor